MAPLTADPAALGSAGTQVVTAGQGLGSVISTLSSTLSGCSGMAGNDPAGAALGHSYDSSASQLVKAMVATRNGLCSLGDGVRMSAHNYSLAEAQSNISGHDNPLPAPTLTGPIAAGPPSSSVGSGASAPAGWGWVAPYIGMIWPTGDSGKLRAAAAAWSSAGSQFALGKILGTGAPMEAIRAQQIPEGPAIDRAFSDAYTSTTGIVQQCQQVAAQLNSYAAKIDQVHASILDLLSRICDPTTGIKEVWDVLTDQDEDEIKKIADDIHTVVDNFGREVDAVRASIAATVSEAAAIATTMEKHAAKQWDQFLHGTDIGRAINQVGQWAKGFGCEAGGFAKGLYNLGGLRLSLDPNGFFHDLSGMVEGAAPLVGLGPDGGPGFMQSWEAVGKDVTHWDEWKTNPADALGRSTFDVATMFLPGGALSKLGAKSRAIADVIRRLKPAELPKVPEVPKVDKPPVEAPHEGPKPPPAGPKPPEPAPKPPEPGPKPQEPGRPAPMPAKPGSAPAESPVPHGPTESKPPVGGPPHGEPKPVAAPPESGRPAVPAPAERTPAAHAQPHEHVPARVPAAAAAVPAASAPALPSLPSMPSIPEPPSLPTLPTGGHPVETPPPAPGAPHTGEPGGHPSGPPHPNGAAPHTPADGGTPHAPGDRGHPVAPGEGVPHNPGDGDPHHPSEGEHNPPDDAAPPPLHRDDPLPTKQLLDHYKGENDPNNPLRAFAPKTVQYMSAEQLEKSRLFVKGGLLHRALDGMLFDTARASTHWSGSGRAMFVMDEHGNLYASLEQDVGRLHHSSFLGGNPVAGAGELEVRNGIPQVVSRKSGHYMPTVEQLLKVRDMLREQGIDVSGITFEDGF